MDVDRRHLRLAGRALAHERPLADGQGDGVHGDGPAIIQFPLTEMKRVCADANVYAAENDRGTSPGRSWRWSTSRSRARGWARQHRRASPRSGSRGRSRRRSCYALSTTPLQFAAGSNTRRIGSSRHHRRRRGRCESIRKWPPVDHHGACDPQPESPCFERTRLRIVVVAVFLNEARHPARFPHVDGRPDTAA